MTTQVTVKVPEGASYVGRVTTFDTASTTTTDVQPGAEQSFYVHSTRSIQVIEAPIAAVEVETAGASAV